MQEIVPGLFASAPMSPDFAPRSSVRAYLVPRPGENVLLYASETVRAAAPDVLAFGGIDRILLSHWHEAMFGAAAIGAPIHVAAADRAAAAEHAPIAGGLDPARAPTGIEYVPMPGHTPGSTAFLVTLTDRRALFTGDTIWFGAAGWKVAVLPDSDRIGYRDSLRTLRSLDFDVLVPSFAPVGAAPVQAVTRQSWQAGIDTLLARIEAGEDF